MPISLRKYTACGTRQVEARALEVRLRRTLLSHSLGLLAGALCATPAIAALSDTLHPFVSASYSYDDNLLRLPEDASVLPGPRSDTIRQLQAGLLLERPIGRQILSGQAKFSRVNFERFQRFDYSGKDLLAALEWHVGNHVDGHLSSSYAQTLAPFTDFFSNERNLRLQRHDYVDAGWRLHPSWRVSAAAGRDKISYDLAQLRFNDRFENSKELGVDYLASSGSIAGLRLRRVTTDYRNHRTLGSFVLDDDFAQDEVKANVDWLFSGITRIRFLGGWVRRRHDASALLDASGKNGRLIVDWAPLGKLRFTATGWREFAAVESSIVNSSLSNGASLGADWDVSAKVRLNALLKREKRDFSAVGGIVLPGAATDTTHSASMGLVYAPQKVVQLGLNVFHDRRAGSPLVGTGSYRASGASLSVSAQF
jgi:exopolysaccharide biosynthesis operon protein EpsL